MKTNYTGKSKNSGQRGIIGNKNPVFKIDKPKIHSSFNKEKAEHSIDSIVEEEENEFLELYSDSQKDNLLLTFSAEDIPKLFPYLTKRLNENDGLMDMKIKKNPSLPKIPLSNSKIFPVKVRRSIIR